MQAQHTTPEEKLLRLIESEEKGGSRKTATRRTAFRAVRTWTAPELNPKLINQGLIVLLLLLVAAIALNLNRVQPSLKHLSSQVAASMPPAEQEPALASLRPLADYVGEVEQRDIFNAAAAVVAPKPEPKKPQPEAKPKPVKQPTPVPLEILQAKAKNLKLVGIAWGQTPIAMIEDTEKRETSFVKAGQFINEIQVKTILKDRVVLSYRNAEYDLF